MANGTLPAYPVSGETVLTEWGTDLIDTIGERVYFVRNPVVGWSLDSSAENGVIKYHELTHLPANDPDIVAAECSVLIRDTNVSMALRHYQPDLTGAVPAGVFRYNTGTNARGGTSGSGFLRVGGVNNRQIAYSASDGSDAWIRCHGWWKRAHKAPYPIEGDPIVAGWGQKVQEQLAPGWAYTPHFERIVNDVAGTTTRTAAPILTLPNDPDIVAVSIGGMIRDDSGGDNINLTINDADANGVDGTQCASIYSSGQQGKGGMAGPFIALLPNGARTLEWQSSATGCSIWIWVFGYWRKTTGAGSLILPPPPVPGEPISSAWARDLIDSTGRRMGRPVSAAVDLGTQLNAVDGQTVIQETELIGAVPTPTPQYALLTPMIRDNNGTGNINLILYHPDDTHAGYAYSEGVQNRGGGSGPYMVKLGGPNGKSFRWSTSEAGTGVDAYVYCHGFAYQETP